MGTNGGEVGKVGRNGGGVKWGEMGRGAFLCFVNIINHQRFLETGRITSYVLEIQKLPAYAGERNSLCVLVISGTFCETHTCLERPRP